MRRFNDNTARYAAGNQCIESPAQCLLLHGGNPPPLGATSSGEPLICRAFSRCEPESLLRHADAVVARGRSQSAIDIEIVRGCAGSAGDREKVAKAAVEAAIVAGGRLQYIGRAGRSQPTDENVVALPLYGRDGERR